MAQLAHSVTYFVIGICYLILALLSLVIEWHKIAVDVVPHPAEQKVAADDLHVTHPQMDPADENRST